MDQLIHADIFFFITSIAVVFITILLGIALMYLIAGLQRFRDIARKLEASVYMAEDEIREITERVTDSTVFNMLFPRRSKRRTAKEKK